MRGTFLRGTVKPTRASTNKPDFRRVDVALTVADVRHPAIPWLPIDSGAHDIDDLEFACNWFNQVRRMNPGPSDS